MPRLTLDVPDDPRAWALVGRLRELGATPLAARRTLVTGGARSGKSSYAESLFTGEAQVDYVATSARNDDDPEWMARIAAHVARRPASWRTLETLDIAGVLGVPGNPVLVDCLGVWLTRILDDTDFWTDPAGAGELVDRRVDELARAIAATPRRVVLVTNEVGSGVVPGTESGRGFRDRIGILNARIADACDELVLCVAGRAVSLPRPDTDARKESVR
ncbi:MAG: bifunctional adenosylcobinamide kinase/adenosylcobinamide-phosphate guanylyltransferase [Propionibacterium sp.]